MPPELNIYHYTLVLFHLLGVGEPGFVAQATIPNPRLDQAENNRAYNGIYLIPEALELFLWKKDGNEVNGEKLRAELADVFYSAFLLAAHYRLDVKDIVLKKLESNKQKYPVEKARGRNEKYDELD